MRKRKIYVVCGFLALLFAGISFAWSLFVKPLELAYGFSRSSTSLAFTCDLIFFAIGCVIAGMVSSKIKTSHILRIAAIMMGFGFFMLGFVRTPMMLIGSYSLFAGMGCGAIYNTIMSVIPLWYPEKSGTITGILLVGYALTGAILGTPITMLIEKLGIAMALHVIGIIMTAVIFLCGSLMNAPSIEDLQQLPEDPSLYAKSSHNVITSEMIRKPVFYMFFIGVVLCGGAGSALINHISPIAQEDFKLTASMATLIIGLNSLFNGVGRIVSGIIYDKFRLKAALIVDIIAFILDGGLLVVGIYSNVLSIFIVGCMVTMFAFGADASNIPTVIRTLFGTRTLSLNLSVMNTNAFPASFIPTIIGLIQSSSGNYRTPIVALYGIILVGSVMFTLLTINLFRNNE